MTFRGIIIGRSADPRRTLALVKQGVFGDIDICASYLYEVEYGGRRTEERVGIIWIMLGVMQVGFA